MKLTETRSAIKRGFSRYLPRLRALLSVEEAFICNLLRITTAAVMNVHPRLPLHLERPHDRGRVLLYRAVTFQRMKTFNEAICEPLALDPLLHVWHVWGMDTVFNGLADPHPLRNKAIRDDPQAIGKLQIAQIERYPLPIC